MSEDPVLYYSHRAPEYDEIYDRPERQDDLAVLKTKIPELLAGRRVLELACGTGWWTQWIAPAAASVLATDASPAMLAEAQAKPLPPGRVTFGTLDAYNPGPVDPALDALFAGFFWSHIPLERIAPFLATLQRALPPKTRFVFADNRYVPGSSLPVLRQDDQGNSYQERILRDGRRYEVIKNFPSADELHSALETVGENVEVLELRYFWLAWGSLRPLTCEAPHP
jgi:demethylmenaquinone methyltransferase/2-methoxy-6-polyprenyl-1,4-benzoquinol methylase